MIKVIVLFLVLTFNVFGQKNMVEVHGIVYSVRLYQKDTLPLKNAVIILRVKDSTTIKQTTDEKGQFKFLISASGKSGILQALSTNKTFNKKHNEFCFMADGNERELLFDKTKIIVADFEFKQFTDCGPKL